MSHETLNQTARKSCSVIILPLMVFILFKRLIFPDVYFYICDDCEARLFKDDPMKIAQPFSWCNCFNVLRPLWRVIGFHDIFNVLRCHLVLAAVQKPKDKQTGGKIKLNTTRQTVKMYNKYFTWNKDKTKARFILPANVSKFLCYMAIFAVNVSQGLNTAQI